MRGGPARRVEGGWIGHGRGERRWDRDGPHGRPPLLALADESDDGVKIATWNVNGVRAREGELQAFIAQEEPDILCLQEIKASVEQLPMWLCDIPGYMCYW